MPDNPTVVDTLDTVTRAKSVVEGATALVRGFNARIQAAVDEAIAGGATAEQLAPVQAAIDEFDVKVADLAQAVVENTPGA